MGLLDDIKNMQPISNKVFTNKDFNKIVKELIKTLKKDRKPVRK